MTGGRGHGRRIAGHNRSLVVLAFMVLLATMAPAVGDTGGAGAAEAGDRCADAPAAPFTDRNAISGVHRFPADCLHHLGIIRGRQDEDGQLRFVPREAITRGQFAGMLHRLLTELDAADDLPPPRRPRFPDVPAGHTFDHEIHTLAAAGIVEGRRAGTFAPGSAVRRDQTASLVMRTAGWFGGSDVRAVDGPYYADLDGNVHRDAIEASFEYGILEGTHRPCGDGGGWFAPSRSAQRQQAASLFVRSLTAFEAIVRGEGGDERADATCPEPVWVPGVAAARDYAESRAGSVSFAAIGTDGELVGYRSADDVAAASVLKVMFLAAYLRHPDVRDRPLRQDDRDLLEPMIRRSANEPATEIADLLGPGPMERLAERAGMREFAYTRPWGATRTSARDQARFMLELDRHLPDRHRDEGLRLLTQIVDEQRWGIGDISMDGWTLYFKGGWGSGTGAVSHQVALLRHHTGTPVSLAVMTTGSPSHDYANETLRGTFRRLLADLP